MPLFQRGDLVGEGDRYKVRRKVGEGQFSEVYEVEDTSDGKSYALKIERTPDVKTIRSEYKLLKRLQNCSQVCKARGAGTHGGRFYIVLDLLGQNLVEMRRAAYGGRMDLVTAKGVALNLLVPLEEMHREGTIHRDVKPANFAIFPPGASGTEGAWTLIDFGLAKRFMDEEGRLAAERTDAKFRGSSTYASAQVLENRDQGRRDDLWSWLYILAELLAGTLPWREGEGGEKLGKEGILQYKLSCVANPHLLLGSMPCPQTILDLSRYLESLRFEDEPNYEWIRATVGRLDEPGPTTAYPPADAYMEIDAPAAHPPLPPGDPTGAASLGYGSQYGYGLPSWSGQAAVGTAAVGPAFDAGNGLPSPPPPPPPLLQESPVPMALDLEGFLNLPRWTSAEDLGPMDTPTDQQQPAMPSELPAMDAHGVAQPSLPPAALEEGGAAALAPLPAPPKDSRDAAEGLMPAEQGKVGEGAAGAAPRPPGSSPTPAAAMEAPLPLGEAGDAAAPPEAPPSHRPSHALQPKEQQQQAGRRDVQARQQAAERPLSASASTREQHAAGGGELAAAVTVAAAPAAAKDSRKAQQQQQQAQQEKAKDGSKKPPRRPGSVAGAAAAGSIERESAGGASSAGIAEVSSRHQAAAATGSEGRKRSKDGPAPAAGGGQQADRGKRGDRGGGNTGGRGRSRSRDRSRDRRRPRSRRRSHSRSSSRSRSRSDKRRQRTRSRSYSPRSPSPSSRSRSRSRGNSRDRRARSRSRDRDSREQRYAAPRDKRRDRSRSRSRARHRSRSRERAAPMKKEVQPSTKEVQPSAKVEVQQAQLGEEVHKRYRETLDYVFALKQGGISAAGEKACRHLRALQPAEALGVICWLMDELGSEAGAKQTDLAAQFMEDVSAFAAGVAKRCWDKQKEGK